MHRYPHEKVCHLAGKINEAGQVSALCFDPPKPIRLAVAGWVAQGKHASCKKCLAILKERGIEPATFSVFATDGQKSRRKNEDHRPILAPPANSGDHL